MCKIKIKTPGKINLSLSVSNKITKGKHEISSWISGVNLYDYLEVQKIESGQSCYKRVNNIKTMAPISWTLKDDLIFKAHMEIEKYTNKTLPVYIYLKKNIPNGSGLGGGSSNAAGVLLAINKLFKLNIPHKHLVDIAINIGSDVPFFLTQGNAIISGVGQKIQFTNKPINTYIALVLPQIQCNTKDVYNEFDTLYKNKSNHVINEISQNNISLNNLFNDLKKPCFNVYPDLRKLVRKCEDLIGLDAHLSGSGSGFFFVCKNEMGASDLSKKIKNSIDARTYTLLCGAQIEMEQA